MRINKLLPEVTQYPVDSSVRPLVLPESVDQRFTQESRTKITNDNQRHWSTPVLLFSLRDCFVCLFLNTLLKVLLGFCRFSYARETYQNSCVSFVYLPLQAMRNKKWSLREILRVNCIQSCADRGVDFPNTRLMRQLPHHLDLL
jgi:hypothetical protein